MKIIVNWEQYIKEFIPNINNFILVTGSYNACGVPEFYKGARFRGYTRNPYMYIYVKDLK